jgi:glucose-6-phosphate-specific signal transduction histidine kinase
MQRGRSGRCRRLAAWTQQDQSALGLSTGSGESIRTIVAKPARAKRAAVTAHLQDGALRVHVRDDGVGGARPDGSGLLGLRDRLAALGGRLSVESPPDGGTLVAADIPVAGS